MSEQVDPAPAPGEQLRRMINGYQLAQCLFTAAELGIADLLRDGPLHYLALAQACSANPAALFRLLRALTSAGVLASADHGWFELTPLGQGLRRDGPGSLHALAVYSARQAYPTWGNLQHSIQTGETAFDALHGQSVWEYRQQDPEAGRVFAAMAAGTAVISAVVKAADFSHFNCVVDVGGGQGSLLAAILQANPFLSGILFEQAPLLEQARAQLARAGVLERCRLIAGDFLQAVPPGGDAYILQRVLHDWADEQALQILTACRAAMQAGQSLLLVERVLPANSPAPLEAALTDLTMLVMNGGRERTEAELNALLNSAGFVMDGLIPTQSPFQIIIARPG